MYEEQEMTNEMESIEETELEPVDYDMTEEGEESDELDLAKILKGLGLVLGVGGLIAYAKRDKIKEKKKANDEKKLEKLAAKLGKKVVDPEEVIEADYKEVDSDDDDCETEEEEN